MAIKSVSISPEFLEGENGSALTFEEADFVDGVWERKVQAKTDSDGDSCDVIVVTDSKNDDGSDMTAKETIEIERTVIALFDKVKSVCKVGISYQVGYTITGEKEKDDLVRFPSGVTRVDYVFDSDDGTDANVSVGEWTGGSELRKTSSVSADRPGTLTLYLYINDALFDRLSIVFVDIVLDDLIEALQERGMTISDDADIDTAVSVARSAIGIFGYEYKWNEPGFRSNGYFDNSTGGAELIKYESSIIDDSALSELDDNGKICLVYGYIIKLKYNIVRDFYFKNRIKCVINNSASATLTGDTIDKYELCLKAAENFNPANAVEEITINDNGYSYSVNGSRFGTKNVYSSGNGSMTVTARGFYPYLFYSDPFYFAQDIVSSKNGTITMRGCKYNNGSKKEHFFYFKKYNFKDRFIGEEFDDTDIGLDKCKEEIRDGSYIKWLAEVNKYYVYADFCAFDFKHSIGILLEMSDLKHVA